ncbi:MAG: arginase [Alphaproteobacteria bacterium]|nr:arginase [Alphaproteobacteria bacterium]
MKHSASSRGSCRIRPANNIQQTDLYAISPTPIFAVSSGIGAIDQGCADGPQTLKGGGINFHLAAEGCFFQWIDIPLPLRDDSATTEIIGKICRSIAEATQISANEEKFFTVLGGDHSCAIGTWSGVAKALEPEGDLGLIWLDAHLDSHTSKTSPSGAYHGMPLACLLGYGDDDLTNLSGLKPALHPQNLCVLGARSYEQEEYDLLMGLGVRIIFMDEIKEHGLTEAFKEALEIAASDTIGFGLSIDLDSIDPRDAPGVGTPEPDGLRGVDVIQVLSEICRSQNFLGLEIVEFNPQKEMKGKTTALVYQILSATLPKGR